MKKYLSFILLLAIFASGCNKDVIIETESPHLDGRVFTASFEQSDTRTYVEEGNLLRWNAGDQISLFDSNTLNRQYQFDGETGDNSGTFSIVNAPFGTGNDLGCHYALYPYASNVKITESGVIIATLPAVQSYAENSFGLGANTMVAVTKDVDDTFLKFRNVGGYLKLQLYGDNVTVKSITLTGNNNEKLAGKAAITHAYGQSPILAMSDDTTTSITLDCGDGVKIGSTEETATAFWIVVPPTTFEEGFEITITDINGDAFIKTTSNEVVIERNIIKPMSPIKVKMESLSLPNGFTFNAIIGAYVKNNGLNKIKFIANSEMTSDTMLWSDEDGTTGYLVANGECLEIHTIANSFMANTDCSYMFSAYNSNWEYTYLGEITEIDWGTCFNVSKVENMSYMFYESMSLSTLNLRNFNTKSVTDMSSMFNGCSSLTSLDVSGFQTNNVTDMSSMFNVCSLLTSLDVSGFQTNNVADMSYMFNGCSSLTSIDVSGFQTNNVADMSYMFNGCSLLTSLDVSGFQTNNVADMSYMFNGCSSLTSIDVGGFNTNKVTDLSGMFNGCSLLKTLNIDRFNTANATHMHSMFRDCSSLTHLDVSGFNTNKATVLSFMFYGCKLLKTLDVSQFNTENVSGMNHMFGGCLSLQGLDLLSFTFDKYPDVSYMLDMVGSSVDTKPIQVKVSKEGYIYFTQVTSSCNINADYAKFVNDDGSNCEYEQDPRIYNGKTMAEKPILDDNNIYLIQSAANLKWFMENCEGEYYSAHYKLTTDIISSHISWDPVWFGGVFDGGNHYIDNLNFYGYEDLAYGFFDSLSGTVKNLILRNPKISQSGDNDGYGMNSGLLAATASGSIINCGIIGGSISVSSTSKAWATGGGLVGCLHNGAMVKGCYVDGTRIQGSNPRNGVNIGGLVGELSPSGKNITITSCYTKNITISEYGGCRLGTFLGHSKSSELTINTCYYDDSNNAIGGSYTSGNIVINTFEVLSDSNFSEAISKMNANLTDCDYIFGEDGSFVKNK